MQDIALQITTALLLILLVCFVWVLGRTQRPSTLGQIAPAAYRLQRTLFVAVSLLGVAITWATLTPWPHDAQAREVTRSIDVKARQWAWELSDTQAQVGEVIEFRVTSEDVNHSFALYDPDKRVLAQIQAMPGFTNTVRHRFERPGTYEILCLEYCGLAHHSMAAQIQVRAATP